MLNGAVAAKALKALVTHPPRLIACEICGGTRLQIRTDPSPRIGSRCLSCRGTAHHRGTFRVLRDLFGPRLEKLRGSHIYEISAHGALYNAFRRLRPELQFDLKCSEFHDRWVPGQIYDGIYCQNIEQLTFPDRSFDLVTSTGLMEHVENDAKGYREVARVLKPGGYYVFTVPYHENCGTIARAERDAGGEIRHLKPPEYHSDPWHPNGVFTWRNYGPDIVDIMTRSGFAAEVRKVRVSGLDCEMPIVVGRVPQ